MTFAMVRLSEVAELTVGHVGAMADEYVASGVPFLRSLNVEPFRVSTDDLKFITPEFHQRLRKSALRPGDVVIIRTGKPGTCAVVPDWLGEANCSDLVIIRCGPQIDPRYLSYWVNSLAGHHIGSNLVGAVQQHFNVGSAKAMPILLPSSSEQGRILSVLASLDDKIELNLRMNETLEAVAQAIFRDWFVNFGPVRRKLEGATDPVAIMGGLTPDPVRAGQLARLFPEALDEDPALPTGWGESTLGEKTVAVLGGTPSRKVAEYWDGSIPWINSGAVNQFRITEPSELISEQGLSRSAAKLLPRRTTVLAITGATLGQVSLTEIETSANQSVVGLVHSGGLPPEFVYLWVKEVIDEIVARQTGGAQQHINKGNVEEQRVLTPPEDVLRAWSELAVPLFDLIASGCFQNHTLAETRDYLLPRLMSGQVRVSNIGLELTQ